MTVTAEMEGNSSFFLAAKYAGRSKQTNKQYGVRQDGKDGRSGSPPGALCQPVHLKLMPQQTLFLMQGPNEYEVGVGKKTGRHK